ncbi:toll/interleukin-1 receptor domain-containing protein [Mesobacillus jeotgali]|uniref:toll/interleukin-1 receptor domain-containing protein n=1 Tax=Mesobacillus jeotgali TaxID=129985 RepID=UPI000C817D2F|nr:toll/interleukin-1 receptor domain-containing protein [Mesobacillus jeotgali]
MNLIKSVERVEAGIFLSEPASSDETSFVYRNLKKEYRLVENGEKLSKAEVRVKGYTTRYSINRNALTYRYSNVFRSKEQIDAINVAIQFSIVVENPVLIVDYQTTNIKLYLDNIVSLYLKAILRDYRIQDIMDFQQSVNQLEHNTSLVRDLSSRGIKMKNFHAMVTIEEKGNNKKPIESKETPLGRDEQAIVNKILGTIEYPSHKQFDVFISYSDKDRNSVFAICNKLEAKGIRCWVAYRDIPGGKKWSSAIVEAIKMSRVFLLVFSSNSNNSDEVEKEIGLGWKYCEAIIPFRIENIVPSDSMEYHLNNVHWIDALTEPREKEVEALSERILKTLPDRKKEIEEATPRKRNNNELQFQMESLEKENSGKEHEVYISYSSEDSAIAQSISLYLENNQIKCWKSPDDMGVGEVNKSAIENSNVFIVLISNHSIHSEHVKNEIQLAVNKNLSLLPVRLEEVTLPEEIKFYLHHFQLFNALDETNNVYEQLVKGVKNLVSSNSK